MSRITIKIKFLFPFTMPEIFMRLGKGENRTLLSSSVSYLPFTSSCAISFLLPNAAHNKLRTKSE